MKAKVLLTSMGLAAVFAACTNEELVPNQEQFKTDLDQRPVVGNVQLSFGDKETRAALGDRAFNTISFDNEDGIGARIIDQYVAASWNKDYHINGYMVTNDYASSNYQYVNKNGNWSTNALMVEGYYMFYYPYNATNVARTPITINPPLTQKVVPSDDMRDPIETLYAAANGEPVLFGVEFIDERTQGMTVDVDLQHIYAYPKITLDNQYTVKEGEPAEDVKKPLTVKKIVFSGTDAFIKKGTVNQTLISTNLFNDTIQTGKDTYTSAGAWFKPTDLLSQKTSDILLNGYEKVSSLTVEFDGDGLVVPAGDKKEFYVVMPAGDYTNLSVFVYLSGDKQLIFPGSNATTTIGGTLSYGPGKRYPKQEYNFPETGDPQPKSTAGKLATITLQGTIEDANPVIPADGFKTNEEFYGFLRSLESNGLALEEVSTVADIKEPNKNLKFALANPSGSDFAFQVNKELVDTLKKYNGSTGSIKFISKVKVAGDVSLNDMEFAGGFVAESGSISAGNVKITGNVEVKDGTFTVGASDNQNDAVSYNVNGGTLTVAKNGYIGIASVELNAGTLNLNANSTLNRVTLKNGTLNNTKVATLSSDYEIAALATNKSVTIKNTGTIDGSTTFDIAIPANVTLNNEGTIKDVAELTNAGTIENEGTMTVYANDGTILNSGELVVAENNEYIEILKPETSVTTVNGGDGTGEINNSAKGRIYAAVDQTVSYTFTSAVDNIGIDALNPQYYAINKIVFTKPVTLNAALTSEVSGVTALEFKAGADLTLSAGVKQLMSVNNVIVSGSVKFAGWMGDEGVAFKKDATIQVNQDCTLTLNNIILSGDIARNTKLTINTGTVSSVGTHYKGKIVGIGEAAVYFGFAETETEKWGTANMDGLTKKYATNYDYR